MIYTSCSSQESCREEEEEEGEEEGAEAQEGEEEEEEREKRKRVRRGRGRGGGEEGLPVSLNAVVPEVCSTCTHHACKKKKSPQKGADVREMSACLSPFLSPGAGHRCCESQLVGGWVVRWCE